MGQREKEGERDSGGWEGEREILARERENCNLYRSEIWRLQWSTMQLLTAGSGNVMKSENKYYCGHIRHKNDWHG